MLSLCKFLLPRPRIPPSAGSPGEPFSYSCHKKRSNHHSSSGHGHHLVFPRAVLHKLSQHSLGLQFGCKKAFCPGQINGLFHLQGQRSHTLETSNKKKIHSCSTTHRMRGAGAAPCLGQRPYKKEWLLICIQAYH